MDSKAYANIVIKSTIQALHIIQENSHAKHTASALEFLKEKENFARAAKSTIEVIERVKKWTTSPATLRQNRPQLKEKVPFRFKFWRKDASETLFEALLEVYYSKLDHLQTLQNVCEKQLAVLEEVKSPFNKKEMGEFYKLCLEEQRQIGFFFQDKDANMKIVISYCREFEQNKNISQLYSSVVISTFIAVVCGFMGMDLRATIAVSAANTVVDTYDKLFADVDKYYK